MSRPEPARHRRAHLLIFIFALIGLLTSVELLRIHLTVAGDPDHPFACHISEAVDCNAVALSQQAVLWGAPVPVWAILTYLLFMVMAAIGLRSKDAPGRHAGDYALVLAGWSVIYSGYLAWVSAFELKTFCLYCAVLYAVNAFLFLAALGAARPLKEFFHRRIMDLAGLFRHPLLFALSGALGALLLAGVFLWSRHSREPTVFTLVEGGKIDFSGDPSLGNPRGQIIVIEFSDFDCVYCQAMHPHTKALLERYPDQLRLIPKNFPLDSKCNPYLEEGYSPHPHGCEAARAAECAHRFGKFESYSERLWSAAAAKDLGLANLLVLAREQGLDPNQFRECMESPETQQAILKDLADGKKLGVDATPTFIVNGYKFTGYKKFKWCTRLIDRLLAGKEPVGKVNKLVEP